jgi:hypothetical protein
MWFLSMLYSQVSLGNLENTTERSVYVYLYCYNDSYYICISKLFIIGLYNFKNLQVVYMICFIYYRILKFS